MLRNLIFTLTLLSLTTNAYAGSKANSNRQCNSLIQMGLINNLIATDRLKEQFPELSKASLNFIKADFERTKQLTEKAITSGKAPPTALLNQMMERTDLTLPTAGKRFPVEGRSDLLGETKHTAHKAAIDEEKTAQALGDMGYKVKFYNESQITKEKMLQQGLNPSRTPDLEINGKIFDIYTPASANSANTASGVINKIQIGQTHRVVINMSEFNSTPEKLQELSRELHTRNPDGLHEVLAVKSVNGATQLVRIFP